MTPDQRSILDTRSNPLILRLWWVLQPLKCVVRFMNTGAHPDDETTAMLAALGLRDGLNLSYACSTRGEGGQNDIGTEAGTDLGALRTAEMERAASVLGMRLYWHSESAQDTITDFGFSKSGVETLEKWGRERTLRRFVEIVRQDRPDIICPTFLDVPGQHGHHRAMTALAREVFEVAADPDFVTEDQEPWAVKKLYLPAWSGAGTSYDDDLPPPPTTLSIPGHDFDPISGWSWGLIGEHSRVYHRTQAMGRWSSAIGQRDWDLHLLAHRIDREDTGILSGLPATLIDLGEKTANGAAYQNLRDAQNAIDHALAAFPVFQTVAECLLDALGSVRAAIDSWSGEVNNQDAHRLKDKERQISRALRIALRVDATTGLKPDLVRHGESTAVSVHVQRGQAGDAMVSLLPEPGWQAVGLDLTAMPEADLPTGYRSEFDPLVPPAPALLLRARWQGIEIEDRVELDRAPVLLPARGIELNEAKVVLNAEAGRKEFEIGISDVRPVGGEVSLEVPSGWSVRTDRAGLLLKIPDDAKHGLYQLPVLIDGEQAYSIRRIDYEHIRPTARAFATRLSVRVLSVTVPKVRVGYIGGGNDRVAHWLNAIGADVTDLSGQELDAERLSSFDSLVIGIFAMKFASELGSDLDSIHDWTRSGGTLVTLYHRPWDNWDPEQTPPLPLEIGQPSLRWRVTNERAKVTHLVPNHPLLTTPNPIGPETWEGWAKERGLYFAKSWDPAYVPLVAMADPDEDPHMGAILAADVGKGRHVHTSLILHHQMEQLVPGGFELMCNLIARRD